MGHAVTRQCHEVNILGPEFLNKSLGRDGVNKPMETSASLGGGINAREIFDLSWGGVNI